MDDQLSFLSDLDAASDTRKPNLCKTWKNAIMNDCGVFTVNRMDFEAHEKKRAFPNVEIHCAMEYPRVYVSFSLMGMSAGGGYYPNRDDMNFDVHEHPANVMLMIEHAIAPKVGNDKKMQKLMREALDKMEKSIKADVESEPAKEQETEAKTDEDGWLICKTCGEKIAGLCKDGNCAECDYKKKHPDAQKKYCEQCIHFFYHDLYDENNHTECCCKLHLEGKNRGEWSYLCDDFVKCETAEQHEIKRAGLMKYASYKQMEKCSECGKKRRWLYGDICGVCYEKKRKKADEIARGFKAEGWKEVPEKERPMRDYEKQNGKRPIIGTRAEESFRRAVGWMKSGCNSFAGTRAKSTPLSLWVESDVWRYIQENGIKLSPMYTDGGMNRTGCMFCPVPIAHGDFKNVEYARTHHPKMYETMMIKHGLKALLEKVRNTNGQMNFFSEDKQ